MGQLKNAIDPASPGIRRKAKRYELKLRRILLMAARRDSRRSTALGELYRTAVVEGISPRSPGRTAVITFKATALRGTVFEMYDWSALDTLPEEFLVQALAWTLRENLRERRR